MKIFPLLVVSFLHFTALAQKTETYYDFYWKPCSPDNARYYGVLQKTDSGWFSQDYFLSNRSLQMQALFEDKERKIGNGYCQYYFANGNPSFIGRMVHGKEEGICVHYSSNGMIADSALFHEGRVVDKRLKWHRNGYMSDSISRVNDSTDVQVGWFDDGALSYAGYLANGKENGKWKYYHHNGQLSSVEIYDKGKVISSSYFDESGKPQTDTSGANREAGFQGGDAAWLKYLGKNLYWPENLQFKKNATITIGIDFIVDENGKIEFAEVSLPFHPEFDAIALKIVKNSPAWIPATSHNRKVKAYRRQPVSFEQSGD